MVYEVSFKVSRLRYFMRPCAILRDSDSRHELFSFPANYCSRFREDNNIHGVPLSDDYFLVTDNIYPFWQVADICFNLSAIQRIDTW